MTRGSSSLDQGSPLSLPSHATLSSSAFSPMKESLRAFARALLDAPFRAVGPRTLERVLDEIVIDSLSPVALGLLPSEGSALDLGCGPGIPLIPLCLASPSLSWTGVDSAVKRLNFVRAIAGELGLKERVRLQEHRAGVYGSRKWDIRRECTPPPSIQPFLGRQDVVVARGTAPVLDVVAMASGFLAPGGRLLIYATADSAQAGVDALSHTDWIIDARIHCYRRENAVERAYAILEVTSRVSP